MSDPLRVVSFTKPEEFVETLAAHDDDAFMNFPLGSLLDAMKAQPDGNAILGRHLYVVIHQSRVLLSLSRNSKGDPWILRQPLRAMHSADSVILTQGLRMLASTVSAASPFDITPEDEFSGKEDLLHTFLEAVTLELQKRGIALRPTPPRFARKLSYTTSTTITPPPPLPQVPNIHLELAAITDADILMSLYLDFIVHGPERRIPPEARRNMEANIARQEIWVCRAGTMNEVIGYCAVGRATPRTIAIRNVYVSPKHRRQGVGEFMTRVLTRLFLGADLSPYREVLRFDGAEPPQGVKAEICLNVVDDNVEEMYKRCGFLFGASVPGSTGDAWVVSVVRGLERALCM